MSESGRPNVDAKRGHAVHHEQHAPACYERIRIVGRGNALNEIMCMTHTIFGSFGLAILYRRKDDESLVILKEINLHDLSSNERQLALNEVGLLSRLHHPHIISYYDSFEKDGLLMIEMEYADGGNLAQLLSAQTSQIAESKVVSMFEQITCAVAYLHENHILHRDLKTANIFLTTENMVKVGDFGISKRLGTETSFQGAQTILGTPYYLSPEMYKGNTYDEKSDIWALGCCLYEMICLRKTFDGTSFPELVRKIVNAEYEQVNGPYSNQLKLLLREMLRPYPTQRPRAVRVLEIIQRHQNHYLKRIRPPNSVGRSRAINIPIGNSLTGNDAYSTIYKFDITLTAIPTVPAKLKIKQLAVGLNHQVLLTFDGQAYSWGDNIYGQLGHGDRAARLTPTKIESLHGHVVAKTAVDQGIMMSCGNRKFMGNDMVKHDWLKARIIDSLLRENIVDLACGDEHCIVLCENGDVFAWGHGEHGQLGLGEDYKNVFVPTKVNISTHQMISHVKCGPDCTLFITSLGTALATGSNKHNKLNLNKRLGFFANEADDTEKEVSKVVLPSALPIKAFRSRIIDADLGPNHSGVLLENGRVHLFGSNNHGELGTGNSESVVPCSAWIAVRGLQNKTCVHLTCGDGFTMVSTVDSELYFWGSYGIIKSQIGVQPDCCPPVMQMEQPDEDVSPRKFLTNNLMVLQPTLVLRLASVANTMAPITIETTSLVCSRNKVFVVVDTLPTASKLRRQSAPEKAITNNRVDALAIGKDSDTGTLNQLIQQVLIKNKSAANREDIIREIQAIGKKLQAETDPKSASYEKYMKELETKIAELESPDDHNSSGRIRSTILKNTFPFSSAQSNICIIL